MPKFISILWETSKFFQSLTQLLKNGWYFGFMFIRLCNIQRELKFRKILFFFSTEMENFVVGNPKILNILNKKYCDVFHNSINVCRYFLLITVALVHISMSECNIWRTLISWKNETFKLTSYFSFLIQPLYKYLVTYYFFIKFSFENHILCSDCST